MTFVKLIRTEGRKEIHETLDLPSGDGRNVGTDRLVLCVNCSGGNREIDISQKDLEELCRIKIQKNNNKTS